MSVENQETQALLPHTAIEMVRADINHVRAGLKDLLEDYESPAAGESGFVISDLGPRLRPWVESLNRALALIGQGFSAPPLGHISPLDTSVGDIVAERLRQVHVEGFVAGHDDEHKEGELSRAAVCYAMSACNFRSADSVRIMEYLGNWWPWSRDWWKPTDQRRDLVKAGALILAEIERLDRAADPKVRIGSIRRD